jgi:hypothetical protein
MTVRSIIRLSSLAACVGLFTLASVGSQEAPQALAADAPAAAPPHQVIACYFHRTNRCPTCRRIGAYIEESVKKGFASQIKEGSVKIRMIDFQDPKNQRYTQHYNVGGPTLVLMDVHDGKVTAWKPAPKVWSLVGDKDAFFRYVQKEVKSYLEGTRTASR